MDETVDAQGARGLDRQIIASGVSSFCLMMRAAKAACDRLLDELRSWSSVWRARGITVAMPME